MEKREMMDGIRMNARLQGTAALVTGTGRRAFLVGMLLFLLQPLLCGAVGQEFEPIPRAGDTFWRDSIPGQMRQSYIRYGERYLGKPWTVLPWTMFAENKITGNRMNYEAVCFDRRRQLAALVMAEIMEGEGRFMNDIVDGMGGFCEETWWGIPAHYGRRIPLAEQQEVDLFNAETANLIVWTAYMLKPQFDRFSPDLCARIDQEIQRRILEPALSRDYWWKTAGMNWNPWICSNWLSCVLLCEKDPGRRQQAIAQIVQAMQAFMAAYPDDGGCDEGPGYWDRAAASLFETVSLLAAGEPAALSGWLPLDRPSPALHKLKAMGSYVYKTYIGRDYCVNFADSHDNKTLQQVNIVYPFGLFIADPVMRGFGAYLGQQKNLLADPAALYDKSGNFPALSRELFFLRHIKAFVAEQPREPRLTDVWLPDLQIMTARRDGLFVAVKGGTNGENHNHNDVGSFIVYADNEPLLIDVGVGEYTARTFSNDRYSIWTMQSGYHNLPRINGTDQRDGKEYRATVMDHQGGQLTLDIAGAYPAEAAVSSWRRTVKAARSGVTITEAYRLNAYREPSQLMLLTPVRPEPGQGAVRLGGHTVSFDSRRLSASVEDISDRLDPLLRRVWGPQMFRIILTIQSTKTNETIKYTIR